MTLGHYLFGFSGRINRAKQWAILWVVLVHNIILGIVFANTVGLGVFRALFRRETTLEAVLASSPARIFGVVFAVLYVIGLYIGVAVATKRLHDRNKSAWWLVVFFALPIALNIPAFLQIPVLVAHLQAIIAAAHHGVAPPPHPYESPLLTLSRGATGLLSLWAFVELYIFRGTTGDNHFGPDPLAPRT